MNFGFDVEVLIVSNRAIENRTYIKNEDGQLQKDFSPGQDRTVDLPVDVSEA